MHRRAQSRARALAYGRARSARRVDAGGFAPWPGWRNLVPAELVVLVDQPTALARVTELVDAEDWRADKRAAWTVMLEVLVQGMDWETGVVAGVTRAQLAERAGVSTRTATSLLGWARGVGLLVMVETGASAAFLGTEKNRAASFVVTVPREWRPRVGERPADVPVDESCHPPVTHVGQESPRRDRGFQDRLEARGSASSRSWPVFDVPTSAKDRAAAAEVFLARAGIGGKVVRWRAAAMLAAWFAADWSPMALLHAVDHHPDEPGGKPRGDAVRSARDPLAVIGSRLRPWQGRLDALPADLRPGARRASVAPIVGRAERAAARAAGATAGLGARAEIRRTLASRRATR